MGASYSGVTYITFDWGDVNPAGKKKLNNFSPVRIIFNGKTTVCYFEDESKTIVTCSGDDEFTEEMGVAMCIAKRAYNNNRNAFLKAVDSGYRQPDKDRNNKIEN